MYCIKRYRSTQRLYILLFLRASRDANWKLGALEGMVLLLVTWDPLPIFRDLFDPNA